MRAESIFGPVCVLALWTGCVLMLTGFRRIRAVVKGRVARDAFRLGETPEVPPDITVVNRNLMNLLEMPLLFYVVCLSFFVTGRVTPAVLTAGWVYVALRLAHSLIHLTSNPVRLRLLVFALSNFVLFFMWISFMRRVL